MAELRPQERQINASPTKTLLQSNDRDRGGFPAAQEAPRAQHNVADVAVLGCRLATCHGLSLAVKVETTFSTLIFSLGSISFTSAMHEIGSQPLTEVST